MNYDVYVYMFPIVNKCICQKDVLCCSVDPAGYHHLHPWEVLWGLHSCSLLDQYDLHGNYQNDDEDVKKKNGYGTLKVDHFKMHSEQ